MKEIAEKKIEWIMGCTICDQGMCEAVENVIDKDPKRSARKACNEVSRIINEQVGQNSFSTAESVRSRYLRFTGKKSDPLREKKVGRVAPKRNTQSDKRDGFQNINDNGQSSNRIKIDRRGCMSKKTLTVTADSLEALILQVIEKMELLESECEVIGSKVSKALKDNDHGIEKNVLSDLNFLGSMLITRILETADKIKEPAPDKTSAEIEEGSPEVESDDGSAEDEKANLS